MDTTIVCGRLTFPAEKLSDVELYLEAGLASDCLGCDTLAFAVWWPDDLTATPAGTAVQARQAGLPPLQFYVQQVEKCGRSRYRFSCVSEVGLLGQERHYGGVYEAASAAELAREICGTHAIAVDAAFDGVTVSGWLPVASRRENLLQLLFATGAVLRRDTAGGVRIAALSEGEYYELRDAELYTGGTVRHPTPATAVDVTEYAYLAEEGEAQTLFEGVPVPAALKSPKGAALTGMLVTWDGPCHSLAAEGAAILESGANYCVLSGAQKCTLTGVPYRRTQVVLRRYATPDTPDETRVVTADRCTLVTLLNSWAVAGRVLDYYSSARTVQIGAVLPAARPGDCVHFRDSWDDEVVGFLESMEITAGATVHRAELTVVAGFTPKAVGGSYNASQLLSGSGSWTVPSGVEVVHLYLIGGGTGGTPGAAGAKCNSHYVYENGSAIAIGSGGAPLQSAVRRTENFSRVEGGAGGEGGSGGAGGLVTELTLAVSPGDTLQYTCGTGGAAGTGSEDPGTGGETTVTLGGKTYSSGSGRSVTGGVRDLFSDAVYGGRGPDGVRGGDGGYGGKLRIARNVPSAAAGPEDGGAGGAAGACAGGEGAKCVAETDAARSGCMHVASGGGGGGASGAAPGGAASGIHGGAGAAGASASPARPGQGGGGGHGGGGGGGYGVDHVFEIPQAGTSTVVYCSEAAGREGTGGAGGAAGAGGAGCVLLYYKDAGVYQTADALHVAYGVTVTQDGAALRIGS